MSNGWINQAYAQGFDYQKYTLKFVNIFERMEIDETVYEGLL